VPLQSRHWCTEYNWRKNTEQSKAENSSVVSCTLWFWFEMLTGMGWFTCSYKVALVLLSLLSCFCVSSLQQILYIFLQYNFVYESNGFEIILFGRFFFLFFFLFVGSAFVRLLAWTVSQPCLDAQRQDKKRKKKKKRAKKSGQR